MVVFTCNHCGDSLQKPKVEKHYQMACRRVKSLTCVDCLKDFHGEDYDVHTKCITEQERYAAKGSIPNGVVKKGEVKQESWVDMIRSIISKEPNLSPKLKSLLETVAEYNNVPRKKHKFMNFIKSSSGGRVDLKIVEDVWNVIEKYKAEMAKPDPAANKEEKNEENSAKRKLDDKEVEDVPKKKKKGTNETDENDTSMTDISKETKKDDDVPKKKKGKKGKKGVDKENDSPKIIKSKAETNGEADNANSEILPIRKEEDEKDEQITKKKKKVNDETENNIVDSSSKAEEIVEENQQVPKKKKKKGKKENGVDDSPINVKKEAENNVNGVESIPPGNKGLDVNNEEQKLKKVKGNKEKNGMKKLGKENLEEKKETEISEDEKIAKKKKENNADNGTDSPDSTEVDDVRKKGETDEKITEFSFEDTITKIMTKKKTTSLKKLQKKVLNAYLKHTGQSEVNEKNIKKFNKKLHKTKGIKIELDSVILLE